jgi:hypothetical protein
MAIKAVTLITASNGWHLGRRQDTATASQGQHEDREEFKIHACKEGGKIVINMWTTMSGGWSRDEAKDPYNNEDNYITEFTTDSYAAFVKEWHNKSDHVDVPSKAVFDTLIKHASAKSSQNPSGW